MKATEVVQELIGVADKLGVVVSFEALVNTVSAGGLCRVNGTHRIIIEKRTSDYERAFALAKALGGMDISDVEMSDICRQFIGRYSQQLAEAG